MMRKLSRFLPVLLIIVVLSSLFTGCNTPKTSPANKTAATQQAASTEQAATQEEKKDLEPITLTEFIPSNSELDAIIGGDRSKIPFDREREKRTGVHIDPIQCSPEEATTRLQLLIASRETPDLVGNNLEAFYAGGAQKAFEDGVIVKLNDYLDKYAPNFKKVLTSKKEFEKFAKFDDGSIYSFGQFRAQEIRVFFGPLIREDLLTAAGLKIPETIDDWYNALTAFKKAGVKYPFTCVGNDNWFPSYSNAFIGAYGVGYDMIIADDGTYKFGPAEPGYKTFLETWSKWFKEGLIDPDYFTLGDMGAVKAKLASGESAAGLGFLSWLSINTAGREKNKDFRLVAAKHPVLNAGETPRFGRADNPFMPSTYVSASCKNIERAIQYLDYGYSEEGHMLFNFGIEGESYNMENGQPKYTELITANPNSKGWTQTQSLSMYVAGAGLTTCYQDKRYFEQVRLVTPEQKQGQPLWAEFQRSSAELPLAFTKEELEVKSKMLEITTYMKEMTQKFIMGSEPLSNFDKYVEDLKKMGVDDVVKVYNDALNRFNSR